MVLVNWDKAALKQPGAVCNYIRKDSLKNAQKVMKYILKSSLTLKYKTEIMSALSLDREINKYLPLLENEEKISLLSQIKSFLSSKEIPKRMTKEEFTIQYNKEIDEAILEAQTGLVISAEDLLRESESW